MRSEDFEQVGKVTYLERKRAFSTLQSPVFWAIASGKGGVGRSFFTSSLGIALSRAGYRVLMVDCDRNGGTLHSWMGAYEKGSSLSDYFRGTEKIETYIKMLGHEKLCLLPGDTCLWNCEKSQVRNFEDLLTDLKSQPYDVVLFDLASGCSDETVSILKKVDEIFLLATPEGASIERTYRWIENYLYKIAVGNDSAKVLCEFNENRKTLAESKENLFLVRDFLENCRKTNGQSTDLYGPIKLVINQTRNFEDERLGDSIKSVCNKYYYTDVHFMGSLQYDNAVWQCARQRVPVLIHQPFNPLVGQIQSLVKLLVDQPSQRAVV